MRLLTSLRIPASLAVAAAVFAVAPSALADDDDDDAPAEETKAQQPQSQGPDVSTAILTDDSGRNVGVARQNVDKAGAAKKKSWTVGTVFETHRLIRREDLNGAGRNKTLNYLYYFAGYGITPYDRVQIRGGIYQRFMADQNESGFRMDDVEAVYTRIIPLPLKITMRANGSVILPLSYESQKQQSLVIAPRAVAQFDRRFGTFNLTWRNSGTYWVNKYKSAAGGSANPYLTVSTSLNGELAMPFHESLSVGLYAYTAMTFQHDPENAQDPNAARFGAVTDPQFGNSQPRQQSYNMSAYARYILPEVNDIKTDITLGVSNGDGTLGSPNIIHDGVTHFYGFWRQSAQVYAQLGVRY